jgi:uncharacterized iron-regulated membrane protein
VTFRAFLMWVHLVLGLTGAIVIAIASVTGAWIIVQIPLERLLIPVPRITAPATAPDYAAMVSAAESRYAPRTVTNVVPNDGRATTLWLNDRSRAFVNPSDGAELRFREIRLVSFENFGTAMRRLHVNLMMGARGRLIVTLATFEAFLLALTGLWLWWRKKHWRFTRWRGSVYRVSWDLHNATGLWFLLPALSMIVTGLLIYVPSPVYAVAGMRPTPYRGAPNVAATNEAASPLPLARLLAIADSAVPNEPVASLALPPGRAGAAGITKASATVYLNRFTGEVVEVRPAPVPNRADRAFEAVEHLHTGELLGAPGMTIMALGSAMLAVMTVTGVVLGWKRILILTRKRADD